MSACPRCHSKVAANATLCPSCGARLDDGPKRTGITIGAWKLRERFHECAAGHTYRAEDTRRPDEHGLVKILRPELVVDEKTVAEFFRDIRTIDAIGHANVIKVREYGERASGDKYLVLEDIDGVDLSTGVRIEGYLPIDVAVSIGIQLANALGAIHEAGLFHQNLRPQSVLIAEAYGRKDFVKLLDAGDATLSCPATPGYMSPEQAAQRPADARSDIYSLGVILYEMVTGRRPFDADTMSDYLFKHMTAEPPKPSELPDLKQPIPGALEELILVCLEKNPSMRPLSMKEVERSLRIIASGSTDATAEVRLDRPPRRRGGRGALVLLFAVGLAAAGVLYWTNLRPSGSSPAAAAPAEPVAAEASPSPAPMPSLPAPEVTAAPQVEILFDSTPQGAEVFRAGETTSLGRTPFRASFERAARNETFEFRLDGHEIVRQEYPLDTPGRLSVELSSMAEEVADEGGGKRARSRKRELARDAKGDKGAKADKAEKPDDAPKTESSDPGKYDKSGVITNPLD